MSQNKLNVFMDELRKFESAGTVYLNAYIAQGGQVTFKVATSINDEEQAVYADYTGQILKVESSSITTVLRVYASADQAIPDSLSVTVSSGSLTGPTTFSTETMSVFEIGPHFLSGGSASYDLTIAPSGVASDGTTLTIQLSNTAQTEDEPEPTIIIDDDMPDPGINPVGRDYIALPAPLDVLELFAMIMTLQQVTRGVIDKTLGRRQSRDAENLRLLTDVNLATAKTFQMETLRSSAKGGRGEGEQGGHGRGPHRHTEVGPGRGR